MGAVARAANVKEAIGRPVYFFLKAGQYGQIGRPGPERVTPNETSCGSLGHVELGTARCLPKAAIFQALVVLEREHGSYGGPPLSWRMIRSPWNLVAAS